MSCKNSIQVAIKVRPLLKKEKDLLSHWKVVQNAIQLVDSQLDPYYFDHIFDQDANNELIFDKMARHIVHSAVKGFNGTIFAYGQTSSGKTYTMIGNEINPGVMVLAAKEVFKEIEKASDRVFLLRVGCIEIYNEKIYDLLNKKNQDLKIHETANGSVNVNCEEIIITCEEDLLNFLCLGNRERTFGETNMNERSSRSHYIFRIIIESRKKDKTEEDAVIQSVLNLVDLAGSERADQTGARGTRLKEGGHINKSLLFLGNVIKSLSENEDDKYISYRDSKLTRILQASLGGNALTSIICTIKPTVIEETQSTLSFAMRAKTIKNKPHVNETVPEATMLKRLEKEIRELKDRLAEEKLKNKNQIFLAQLEKRIDDENLKIISFPALNNLSTQNDKRRRTWSFLPTKLEDSERQTEKNNIQNIHHPLRTPQVFLRETPINATPCIQSLKKLNNTNCDKNNTENSNDLNKLQTIEKYSPTTEKFSYQILNEKNEQFCKISPSESTMRNNLKVVEKELQELKEFSSLEKNLDVNYNVNDALLQKLENITEKNVFLENERIKFMEQTNEFCLTKQLVKDLEKRCCEFEEQLRNLSFSNNEVNVKYVECKENVRRLQSLVEKLTIENQDNKSFEFELEAYKTKAKLREQELLDLLKEKEKNIAHHTIIESKNIFNLKNENKNLEEQLCKLKFNFNEVQKENNYLSSQLIESLQDFEELKFKHEELKTNMKSKEQNIQNTIVMDECSKKTDYVLAEENCSDNRNNSKNTNDICLVNTSFVKESEIQKIEQLQDTTKDLNETIVKLQKEIDELKQKNEQILIEKESLLESTEYTLSELREQITILSMQLSEKTTTIEYCNVKNKRCSIDSKNCINVDEKYQEPNEDTVCQQLVKENNNFVTPCKAYNLDVSHLESANESYLNNKKWSNNIKESEEIGCILPMKEKLFQCKCLLLRNDLTKNSNNINKIEKCSEDLLNKTMEKIFVITEKLKEIENDKFLNEKLDNENFKLVQNNLEAQQKINECQIKITDLNLQLNKLQTDNKLLQNEINSLTNLKDVQTENKLLQNEINNLITLKDEQTEKIAIINEQMNQLKSHNKKLYENNLIYKNIEKSFLIFVKCTNNNFEEINNIQKQLTKENTQIQNKFVKMENQQGHILNNYNKIVKKNQIIMLSKIILKIENNKLIKNLKLLLTTKMKNDETIKQANVENIKLLKALKTLKSENNLYKIQVDEQNSSFLNLKKQIETDIKQLETTNHSNAATILNKTNELTQKFEKFKLIFDNFNRKQKENSNVNHKISNKITFDNSAKYNKLKEHNEFLLKLNQQLKQQMDKLNNEYLQLKFQSNSTSVQSQQNRKEIATVNRRSTEDSKNLNNESFGRKKSRHNTYDENRRESLLSISRNVGSMTEPIDMTCNCEKLDQKIRDYEKKLFIRESQVNELSKQLEHHPLKLENVALVKRLQDEREKYQVEIFKLKKNCQEQMGKIELFEIQKNKFAKPIIKTSALNVSHVETQTESDIESQFRKLDAKYNFMKKLCRLRYNKIAQLEREKQKDCVQTSSPPSNE